MAPATNAFSRYDNTVVNMGASLLWKYVELDRVNDGLSECVHYCHLNGKHLVNGGRCDEEVEPVRGHAYETDDDVQRDDVGRRVRIYRHGKARRRERTPFGEPVLIVDIVAD